MVKLQGTALFVGLTCAATVVGHAWLNWRHEYQMEALLGRTPERGPMFLEVLEQPPVIHSNRNPASLALTAVNFEVDEIPAEQPADASLPSSLESTSSPPSNDKLVSRQQLEDEAAVREVIEEEMSETSSEERDIWFEELKSLPAEAVRDMLQVRKHLRILTPEHQISNPGRLPSPGDREASEPTREIPAEPTGQIHMPRRDGWRETQQSLRRAIDWSLHNLANAATPGYKRSRVVLGDAYTLGDSIGAPGSASSPGTMLVGAGCCIRWMCVDLQQGEIVETGRELDVAINGDGFFAVQHVGSQRPFYTRCGVWTLDPERQLCQVAGGERFLLHPPVVIPESATAIQISPEGTISARCPGEEMPTVVGQISLVRFASPSLLMPQGNNLFLAANGPRLHTADGNKPMPAKLQQFALELSNVNVAQEQADRESWEAILQSLPATEVPRTARQGEQFPQ